MKFIMAGPSWSFKSSCPSVIVISNIKIAMLPTIWLFCWLSGSATSYLAVLSAIWQSCQLSGSDASYLAVMPAIWLFCRLSGSAASYLAVMQCSKLINWTQILKKWTKNRPIFPQKTDQNRPVKNKIQTPFRIFLLFIGKNNAFLIFCLIIIQ